MYINLMLLFSAFVAIISSITIEGKQAISKNVELKWKVEVLKVINCMTMILLMNGGASGICS